MIVQKRSSGILLHITSLPSKFGIGDLGPEAYNFADLLAEAGQHYWQILPLNPTEVGSGNSPYSSHSAFAGNPLLISPELLVKDGLLDSQDLHPKQKYNEERVEFELVTSHARELWTKAYQKYKSEEPATLQNGFEAFQVEHQSWLQDYAQFVTFKKHFNQKSWVEWPNEIKKREPHAMQHLAKELSQEIEFEEFLQYLFYRQWEQLKQYCIEAGVKFIGDMPFYVSHDSADVWANPQYFKLDDNGKPTAVSGVPPDFFSETGQLWGTPVYNWEELEKSDYDWWIRRIDHNLRLFNLLRLDHFRAFSAYWEVPAGDDTAMNGKWEKSPGREILNLVKQKYSPMPIIAEDLGEIDQPVRDLISEFDLPGMLVLIFAFISNEHAFESTFLPHNHTQNSVVYTGTHDNSTVRAWYEEAEPADKQFLSEYSFQKITNNNVHEVMKRIAYASVSQLAILPIQDIIGLGKEAIMNKPSTSSDNWEWRLKPGQFTKEQARELKQMVRLYGR